MHKYERAIHIIKMPTFEIFFRIFYAFDDIRRESNTNLPLRLFQLLNLQTITYKKYVPLILNYCIIYPRLIKVGKDMSNLSLLKITILIYFF